MKKQISGILSILAIITITAIAIMQTIRINKAWDKIHELQQSPDICLRCQGNMEGEKK